MELKRTLSLLAVFLLIFQPLSVFGVSLGDAPSPDVQEAGIISESKYYVQGEYPVCSDGKITEPCKCGEKAYNAGFCCRGIWFDPYYENIFSNNTCPSGNFYFVDQNHPNASDENPGTEELPWETLIHGCAQLKAGDILLVKNGVYASQKISPPGWIPSIQIKNSGTETAPIIVKAYPDHSPIIDGKTAEGYYTFGGHRVNHIIIDGLIVRHGIIIFDESSYITIQNCELIYGWTKETDPSYTNMIEFRYTNFSIVRNCVIHGNKFVIGEEGPGSNKAAIILHWCNDILIENNLFYDNIISYRNKSSGGGVYGHRNIFRKNIVRDCNKGVYMRGYEPLSHDNRIEQNIFINNPKGILLDLGNSRLIIANNVFYADPGFNPEGDPTCGIGYSYEAEYNPDHQIFNNIILNLESPISDHTTDWPPPNLYCDYNCYANFVGFDKRWKFITFEEFKNRTGGNEHCLVNQDPMFVNPEAGDFHLNPNSPCLNAGIDRQDHNNNGNTSEPVNMGAYITGNETIGPIDLTQYVVEEYPTCSQGKITSPCQCGNQIYNAGFCCYHPNANSGIWFEPSYEDILPNGCPTGNFYFVDQNNPNASDENPGTEELPWKTINHAAEVLQAGDTVLVKEGRYNVGASPAWSVPAINPVNSGTPENPITFKVYPGHNVTVFVSEGQAAIGSNGRNYIIWDGFTVEMFERMKGILLHTTKGCVIQNCRVIGNYIPTTDNHDGIRVDVSQDTVIRNCIIHGVKGDSHNSAGFKSYGIDNVIIENCEIYDCTDGIFLKGRGDGNIVRKNVIHNCDMHAVRGYGQTGYIDDPQYWLTDTDIYQNIIYDCGMGTYASTSSFNFKVYNNVFFNCERGSGISNVHNSASYWNNLYISLKYPITCSYEDPTQPIIYSDYNDFYDYDFFRINYHNKTLPEWRNLTGFDQHFIVADPLFVNPESHNFHLQPSSPCLNVGIDRQDYDNDGNTTESINMGAYITGNETIGLIDLSQYIVEESQQTCASQNGVCCQENQTCQNGIFISSSDCGNLCCTGECVSPQLPGDLNDDGHVNVQDIQLNVNVILEIENRSDIIARADVNRDGSVNILDVQRVVNAVLNA